MTTTTYRSTAGGWISADSAALETAALTRALQISISGDGGGEGSSLASSILSSNSSLSSAATPTSSDAAAASISPSLAVQEKKMKKKRKSRAKEVDRTLYINTDPANFCWMVQHVTGIQNGSPAAVGNTVLMPEPRRVVAGAATVLPTLDTSSAFAMERGAGSEFEALREAPTMRSFFHFPTLES